MSEHATFTAGQLRSFRNSDQTHFFLLIAPHKETERMWMCLMSFSDIGLAARTIIVYKDDPLLSEPEK